MKNTATTKDQLVHPYACLPQLAELKLHTRYPLAPDDCECFALWHKYDMPQNIQRHSLMVARIATAMAKKAHDLGIDTDVMAVRASALLHDLAKAWCVQHGGSHAQLGAAWVNRETGHYGVAQGVLLHVQWPWEMPNNVEICTLPFFVIYADKRVKHDKCVTLKERFEDLLDRYGKTRLAIDGIKESFLQMQAMERILSTNLEWELNEYSFDSGRLVN